MQSSPERAGAIGFGTRKQIFRQGAVSRSGDYVSARDPERRALRRGILPAGADGDQARELWRVSEGAAAGCGIAAVQYRCDHQAGGFVHAGGDDAAYAKDAATGGCEGSFGQAAEAESGFVRRATVEGAGGDGKQGCAVRICGVRESQSGESESGIDGAGLFYGD